MARDTFKLFGTWKNKLTPMRSIALAREMVAYVRSHPLTIEISICPSMAALHAIAAEVAGVMPLTAQNVVWDAPNSFTGETSADTLVEIGCKYVMLGHSERRLYLGEDDTQVSRKVETAIQHGLVPLVCVGEFYQDFKENRTEEVIRAQMAAIMPCLQACNSPDQFLIAYEPAWAITTSKEAIPCDPALAQQRHRLIRSILIQDLGDTFAENVSLIYGAGVTNENIGQFLDQADIDGGLAGGASQSIEKFSSLIEAARIYVESNRG